jgi:hypothetical protein
MRTAPRTTVVTAAIVAALLMTPLLSACGGIEGMIGEVTGGAIQPSVGELPNAWPEAVPVIDGEIVGGNKATDPENEESTLWTAIIGSGQDEATTRSTVATSLEAAGFTGINAEGTPIEALAYKNDTYTVLVFVATAEDDTVTATYNVTDTAETAP